MPDKKIAPYGSWKSPITSDLIGSETIALGQIALEGNDTYWVEVRPSEGGRYVIVRLSNEKASDVTPPPYSARTRVHEYGGGAYTVKDGIVYFANFSDQRVYRQKVGEDPVPITPEGALRYADIVVDKRGTLICVQEDHTYSDREAVNTLVRIKPESGNSQNLVSGNDFYSTPRFNSDQTKLAWLTWNHPCMPWDHTELWVAEYSSEGLVNPQKVAGGAEESVFQPEWSPDGRLYFVSDRTGWWNLYCWDFEKIAPVLLMEAEFGVPQWRFGRCTYGFLSGGDIVCTFSQKGEWHMGTVDRETGSLDVLETPYTVMEYVKVTGERVVFCGGSPVSCKCIVELDVKKGEFTVLRRENPFSIDGKYLSIPEVIEFPTDNELMSYAVFYPPRNGEYTGPDDEAPPLIVRSHGGPTDSADTALDLKIQYWTSRGFAVVDVNYGGSTGYGREYRNRLQGTWGIMDVSDCVNAASYLVEEGRVGKNKLAIRGGSAGGYTTLCALTFHDQFKAGASYYGVSDLEALTKETHKFESHYLDNLVGPYPERREVYVERSPIYYVDQLSCPVIFFQGLDDKVVPPNQAEMMVEALRRKGIPVAYLAFEGEQHGFRSAKNIKRALDSELYFYSKIFGFSVADPGEPIAIENLWQ